MYIAFQLITMSEAPLKVDWHQLEIILSPTTLTGLRKEREENDLEF